MDNKQTIKKLREFNNFRRPNTVEAEAILNYMTENGKTQGKALLFGMMLPGLFFGIPLGLVSLSNPDGVGAAGWIMLGVMVLALGVVPWIIITIKNKRWAKIADNSNYEVVEVVTYDCEKRRSKDHPDKYYCYVKSNEVYCTERIAVGRDTYSKIKDGEQIKFYIIKSGNKITVESKSMLGIND